MRFYHFWLGIIIAIDGVITVKENEKNERKKYHSKENEIKCDF